ncbi:hypothetical protein LINPERPRIM_LOCUS37557 [Linum perenne]
MMVHFSTNSIRRYMVVSYLIPKDM